MISDLTYKFTFAACTSIPHISWRLDLGTYLPSYIPEPVSTLQVPPANISSFPPSSWVGSDIYKSWHSIIQTPCSHRQQAFLWWHPEVRTSSVQHNAKLLRRCTDTNLRVVLRVHVVVQSNLIRLIRRPAMTGELRIRNIHIYFHWTGEERNSKSLSNGWEVGLPRDHLVIKSGKDENINIKSWWEEYILVLGYMGKWRKYCY